MTGKTSAPFRAVLAALASATLATGALADPMYGRHGCGDGPGAMSMGPGPAGFGPGHGPGRAGPLGGLRLSAAQQDQVFELRHAQAPREHAAMKAAHEARDGLRALAAAETYDARKAKELAAAHAQAVGELALLHAEFEHKLRALLSPEQRKEFDARTEGRGPGSDRPRFGRGPL